jgi:hypothetical protein
MAAFVAGTCNLSIPPTCWPMNWRNCTGLLPCAAATALQKREMAKVPPTCFRNRCRSGGFDAGVRVEFPARWGGFVFCSVMCFSFFGSTQKSFT